MKKKPSLRKLFLEWSLDAIEIALLILLIVWEFIVVIGEVFKRMFNAIFKREKQDA